MIYYHPVLRGQSASVRASRCGNDGQGAVDREDGSPVVNEVLDKEDVSAGPEELEITVMEAFEIYEDKYPEAKVEEIEFDRSLDLGFYVYELEGYGGNRKYELKISAKDGSIVKEEMEVKDYHQSDGEITKSHVEKIDSLVSEALKDARAGAKLDEWSLEFENGIATLDIEVDIDGGDDIEYKYDVETGKLMNKTK